MLTTDAQAYLRRDNSVKIGTVKDNSVNTGKPGVRNMYGHHKKIQAKLLCLSHLEDQNNDAAYMKELDNFILGCNFPP